SACTSTMSTRTISTRSPPVHGSQTGCATTPGAIGPTRRIAPTRRSTPRVTAGASTSSCARCHGRDETHEEDIPLLYGFSFFDQFPSSRCGAATRASPPPSYGTPRRGAWARCRSADRSTRGSPPRSVGQGIDAWGLPSVLSALGMLFSIAFACLLLPLMLRETALTAKEASA